MQSISWQHLLFAFNIVAWGYNWIPLRIMLDDAGPATSTALRTLGGSLMLFFLLAMMRRSMSPPQGRRFVLIGLTQIAGCGGFSAMALLYGGVGRTAILLFTMPFWTMILARIFYGEQVGLRRSLALGVALAGIFLIAADSVHNEANALGAAFALAGGLSWGIGATLARNAGTADLLCCTAWEQLIGCIPLFALALAAREGMPHLTQDFVLSLAYSAFIAGGLGWFLWNTSARALPASTLALGALGVPIVAAVAAFLQMHEMPNTMNASGLSLVLLGLLVAVTTNQRNPAHAS